MNESEKQFSFPRAAASISGRAQKHFFIRHRLAPQEIPTCKAAPQSPATLSHGNRFRLILTFLLRITCPRQPGNGMALISLFLALVATATSAPAQFVGWACGGADGQGGILLGTTNGATWFRQGIGQLGTNPLVAVAASAGRFVWTVGDPANGFAAVYHSSDAGVTWIRQGDASTLPNTPLHKIWAVDERVVWAVGVSGAVVTTTNGGQMWRTVTVPNYTSMLQGVTAIDAMTAWVSGEPAAGAAVAALFYTADGGSTWVSQGGTAVTHTSHLLGLAALDRNRVWAIGGSEVILVSTNAGTRWDLLFNGSRLKDGNEICVLDDQRIWAAFDSHVNRTVDGGSTWSSQITGDYTMDVSTPDGTNVWAVANGYYGGIIYYSADGGETWTQQAKSATWLGLNTIAVQRQDRRPTLYVAASGTNPVPPYANWQTAATQIQDAIDAASAGALVLVGDGVYRYGGRAVGDGQHLTNRVWVAKPIAVRSLHGPAQTMIVGAKDPDATDGLGPAAVRGVWLGDGASLTGFTVTNGCTLPFDAAAADQSDFQGGGIWCQGGGGAVTNCVITGNTAGLSGGGIFEGRVFGSTLVGNQAPSGESLGGGAFATTLWDCRIVGNRAHSGGGAAAGELFNCLVEGNHAGGSGGGVYGAEVRNCTVVGNEAEWGGGAAGEFEDDTYTVRCELYNSIVFYNHARVNYSNHVDALVYDSCTMPWSPGGVNLYAPPGFAAIGSGFGTNRITGDYHLLAGSPCINWGRNEEWMSQASDFDGQPRLIGGIVDLGVYEFRAEGRWLMAPSALDFNQCAVGATSRLTWVVANLGRETITLGGATIHGPGAAAFQLSGLPASLAGGAGATCTIEFAPGALMAYDATLELVHDATNQATPLVLSLHGRGAIRGDKYVRQDNPAATYPYATWATAAPNIQDAVDAAVAGDTVWVTNGIYAAGGRPAGLPHTLTNRVAVTKPITLRSVNGAGLTWIVGAPDPGGERGFGPAAIRGVWLAVGSSLLGFTITNGGTYLGYEDANTRGGGIYCEGTDTAIAECVATGNAADNVGGGIFGGHIDHCQILGNWAHIAGGVWSAVVFDSRIEGNTGKNDAGGAADCELTRCTIMGNRSELGGGTFGSRHYDCLIANNDAADGGGAYCLRWTPYLLDHCVISNNTADIGAGAYGTDLSSGTSTNCLFVGNRARIQAGATYGGTHYNSVFYDNSAGSEAGAAYSSALLNCSVVSNTAGQVGAGAFGSSIHNTILAGNFLTNGLLSNWAIPPGWITYDIDYSCTLPRPQGEGNITNAPLFVGPGDFHLQPDSPCVNRGRAGAWMEVATDPDGQPRIRNGAPDMGAYESPYWGVAADVDADGFTDWVEVNLTHTNPTNAASCLRMVDLKPAPGPGGSLQVRWTSVEGVAYNVLRTTNLARLPAFERWVTNVPGQADFTTVVDTNAPNPSFYRVEVQR